MSQILVTGEAKIRDIQGPVVANDGVVTALDGAANQYVRGDGTLAVFPTSTGGGSSVSYYLNGSVNQGTIGGVDYKELSKDPIIGTNADFTISSNGYIASFITDANDPDSVIIPGGNWNIEFYFSASSGGGSPYFYVEVYKYDGSTFTLVGSNQTIPEYITAGTEITSYYGAVPIPTTNLSITDRIAVRIYVVPAGRTITLHTQNGHLCQIVTTFSKGILSINGLTDQSQYLATGTSGTDFNIASSGDTHTFNIPSASASNRGLITTGTQTIAGSKTFSTNTTFNQGLSINSGYALSWSGNEYIDGSSIDNTLKFATSGLYRLQINGSGIFRLNAYTTNGLLKTTNADGTFSIATAGTDYVVPSALASYVPYTGATTFVNLGTQLFYSGGVVVENAGNGLIATDGSLSAGKGIFLTNTVSGGQWSSGTTNLVARNSGFLITRSAGGGLLIFDSAVTYDYTFPSSNGTIALTSNLSSYLPLSGGTLTGALSGTTITTSGSATFGSDVFTYANGGIFFNGGGSYTSGIFQQSGGNLALQTGGTPRLTLSSTGAATFSAGITANGNMELKGNRTLYLSNTGVAAGSINFFNSTTSTNKAAIGSYFNIADEGNLEFMTGGLNIRMIINSTGNVGIGTSSPSYPLHVANSGVYHITAEQTSTDVNNTNAYATFYVINNASSSSVRGLFGAGGNNVGNAALRNSVYYGAQSNHSAVFLTNDTERMRILANGQVNPGADNSYGFGGSGIRWAVIWAANGTIQTSDRREKKDILNTDLGLNLINKLRPVSFKWIVGHNEVSTKTIIDENGNEKTEEVITPREGKRRHYGLIAQEVKEALGDTDFGGFIEDEETGIMGLRYDQFVPILIKSIQEQQAQIEELKAKIK